MNRFSRIAKSAVILGLLLGLSLALGGLVAAAADNSTLTIAIRNWDYDTLDPHVSAFTQSWWMINCFTDTLVSLGPDGNFYPQLASSWESQQGGKIWIFHLTEGVTFHNGTPWNADALIANFKRILDPNTKSLWFVDKLKGLDSMEAVDPMTVKLTFKDPNPGFLLAISQPGMGYLSPTAFNNPDNKTTATELVGTGPFILKDEVYQQKVTMVRNPNYTWGPSWMKHEGAPYIQTLVWRFIPEDETRLAALQNGEVNAISEIPPAELSSVKANTDLQVLFCERPGVAQVYHLNAQLAPTDDLAVRQAINYAIDQKTIAETIFKGARAPAYGLIMPASPYYNTAVESMYPYNPDKARQLLENAGWVDPTGSGTGTRMKDGKLLQINFVTYPGSVAEAPAEMAQAMLHQVGIQMNITVLTGGAMMEQAGMVDSTYNSCVCGDTSVDTAMELYSFCHSDMIGKYNFSHYSSPEIDSLINEALTTTDQATKAADCEKVQQIWMEQALCAPIVTSPMVWGASASVTGIEFAPDGTPIFYDAQFK